MRNCNAEKQIVSMPTITWNSHRQVSLLSTLKLQAVSLSEESISYHGKKMHFSSPTLKIIVIITTEKYLLPYQLLRVKKKNNLVSTIFQIHHDSTFHFTTFKQISQGRCLSTVFFFVFSNRNLSTILKTRNITYISHMGKTMKQKTLNSVIF